jgi:hypothetical protein
MPGPTGVAPQQPNSTTTNGPPGSITDSAQTSVAVADFAERLKSLTNYEVWTRVEAAIQTMAPNADTETQEWGRFRVLLEELRWRLSGLEGAGSTSEQVLTIEETSKPH